MNSRTFLVLVSTLVVVMALLFASLEQKQNLDQELMLPGLAVVVNDNSIDQIKLTGAGRKPIATIDKTESGWAVAERFGYPADIAKIRQNILNLARARIVEEKTSDPELYERLGVGDVDAEDAGGVELMIRAPTETIALIVGDTGVQGDHAYVRRPGEARSWLINAELDLGQDANDWLAQEFLDIKSAAVQAVTITDSNQSTLRIEKATADDESFNIQAVPDGRELSYAGAANGVGAVLSALSFDDVMPVAEASFGNVQPVTTRFECFDGLVVTARTYETGDATWTAFEFAAETPLAQQFRAEGSDADAAAEQDKKVADYATEMNLRLGPWLYKLPSFKSDQFVKNMEDLLKPAA